MDILSDVKVVGNLSVSRGFEMSHENMNLRIEGCGTFFEMGVTGSNFPMLALSANGISVGRLGSDISFLGNVPVYNPSCVKKAKIEDFYDVMVPFLKKFTVPANCSKFYIGAMNIGCTDADITDSNVSDYYSYPLITAFSCGKKVEIDVEVKHWTPFTGGKRRFTEVIYGSVSPYDENRDLSVVMLMSTISPLR